MRICTNLKAVKTLLSGFENIDTLSIFNYISGKSPCDDPMYVAYFYRKFAAMSPIPANITEPWRTIDKTQLSVIASENGINTNAELFAHLNKNTLFLCEKYGSLMAGHSGVPFYCTELNPIISSYLQYNDDEFAMCCDQFDYKTFTGVAPSADAAANIAAYQQTLVTLQLAGSTFNKTDCGFPSIPADFGVPDKYIKLFYEKRYNEIPAHYLTTMYGWCKINGIEIDCPKQAAIFD